MAGFIVLEDRDGLPDELDFLMDVLGFYGLCLLVFFALLAPPGS